MRIVIPMLIASFLATSPALAQYKCEINGKTVYADEPCAADAKRVGAPEDQVSVEQQEQRQELNLKERQQRDQIEAKENAEFEARQRAATKEVKKQAAEAERLRQEQEGVRLQRCADLERYITWNERNIVRYKEFGWVLQWDQQEQELRRNQKEYDEKCQK